MFYRLIRAYQGLSVRIKASVWFLFCSFLQRAISAITTPIFTRILTSAEYGQFNVFQSWRGILSVFITLNIFYGVYSTGLVKFVERRNEFISAMQGLALSLILFWCAVYCLFHRAFNAFFSLSTAQMLCMFVILWAESAFSFWAGEQRVRYQYRTLVFVMLLFSLLRPVIEIALILRAEDKVTARIIGIAISDTALFSWMFAAHMRQCARLFSAYFWRHTLKFAIPLIPHYLAQTALNSADRIMIERMVSAQAAGLYSLAYSISMITVMFNSALAQALSPWVYEKMKGRRETEIVRVLEPCLIFIACVNISMIIFAPELVTIFAPASYYEAVWAMPPVIMTVFFLYLYDVFSYYEFYFERTSFISLATIAAAALNLALNYVCIPLFGYVAAGYTTLVCFALYAVGHYIVMKSVARDYLDGNVIVPGRRVMLVAVVFLALGFLFCSLYGHPILRYGIFLCLLSVLFFFRKRLRDFVLTILNAARAGKTPKASDDTSD